MTSKTFNADSFSSITLNMEKSVKKAFDEFVRKPAVGPKMFNGSLRRVPSKNPCVHTWKTLAQLPKDHSDYLKFITEEEPEPGNTKWCTKCGSVSYWENGDLWLFDATTKFFGRPPKRRPRREDAE